MELLSNLTWFAVAICLWWSWLARHRRAPGTMARRVGIELIALVMLSAVLLPVISVSDDLQAARNPIELERTSVRSNRHLSVLDASHPMPAGTALTAPGFIHPSHRWLALLGTDATALPQLAGSRRPHDSRPPPLV
ncbi:MAG: hypothetical protein ACLGXA_16185 [Acidobacteriota bacterium]